jgi:lipopolysaccharide transport system ATP-binding protein
MTDSKNAVEARGITKRFRRRTVNGGYTTFKTQLVSLLTGRRREKFKRQDIEVLKGIDLIVPKGQTLGIIGENGSGKSTLLKILTGIYAPSSGSIQVEGRVSALLELGAGFHPDFSGRENIFINGAILGLTKAEIRGRVDEIIDFSELHDFIDEPVRTYSSGMYMRLAFAVATFVDPEVLIIDEILAVGDDHFARKSRLKMEEFKRKGKTIILVTHDLGTVAKWCDRAVWIDRGHVGAQGDPAAVVDAYRRRVAEKEVAATQAKSLSVVAPLADEKSPRTVAEAMNNPVELQARWGNGALKIQSVRVLDEAGAESSLLHPDKGFQLELAYESEKPPDNVGFTVSILRADGVQVYGTSTFIDGYALPSPLPPRGVVRFVVSELGLVDGDYIVDVGANDSNAYVYDFRKGLTRFAIRASRWDTGMARLKHRWELAPVSETPMAASGSAGR